MVKRLTSPQEYSQQVGQQGELRVQFQSGSWQD